LSREKEMREMRNVEESIKNLRKDVDTRLEELRRQLTDMQKMASKAVAKRPVLALGLAFVAGMAVGIALSKLSD